MTKQGYGRPKIEINLDELEEAVATCKNDTEIAKRFGVGRNFISARKSTDVLFNAAYQRGIAKRRESIINNSHKSQNRVISLIFSNEEYEVFEKEAKQSNRTIAAVIKNQIAITPQALAEKKQITRKEYKLLRKTIELSKEYHEQYWAATKSFVELLNPERFGFNRDDVECSAWEYAYCGTEFEPWFKGLGLEIVD